MIWMVSGVTFSAASFLQLTAGIDLLDEFSTHVQVDSKKPDVPPEGPPLPAFLAQGLTPEDDLTEEDFAKQLQAGMAGLLGEMEDSVRIHLVGVACRYLTTWSLILLIA